MAAFVTAEEIDRGVLRDAKEPRAQRGQLRRLTEGIERLRERILDDVFAVDRGADESRGVAMEVRAHRLDHREELLTRGGEIGRRRDGHGARLRDHCAHARSLRARALEIRSVLVENGTEVRQRPLDHRQHDPLEELGHRELRRAVGIGRERERALAAEHRRESVGPHHLAVAKQVNQIELYTQAAAQVKAPVPDPMRSVKFMDGVVWDGKDPKAYAASFKVKA